MIAMIQALFGMLKSVFGAGHVASHSLDRLAKQSVLKSQQSLDKEVVRYEKHLTKIGKTRQELDQTVADIFADFNLDDD